MSGAIFFCILCSCHEIRDSPLHSHSPYGITILSHSKTGNNLTPAGVWLWKSHLTLQHTAQLLHTMEHSVVESCVTIHWNIDGLVSCDNNTSPKVQVRAGGAHCLCFFTEEVWALKLINIWTCSLLVWFQTLQFNTLAFSYIKYKMDLNSIKRDVSYVFKYNMYVWILSHLVTRQLLKEN